jgi:hypothetical protein
MDESFGAQVRCAAGPGIRAPFRLPMRKYIFQTTKCTFDENLLCLRSWEGNRGRSLRCLSRNMYENTDFPSIYKRSYWFVLLIIGQYCMLIWLDHRYTRAPNTFDDNSGEAEDPVCLESPTNDCKTHKVDMPLSRMSFIDSEYTDDSVNPKVGVL